MQELLASCEGAMVELTRRLIAIPTENPPGAEYARCAALLVKELLQLGFEDARLEGDCVRASCGPRAGEGLRSLYFSGHYDVVPAQARQQFEPRLEGGNLFGRGSSDMKGGLAAMIYAAKAAREAGRLKRGRIELVLVPDEETAGERGTKWLAARGWLAPDAVGMLTPEPTGGVIWNANRGAMTLRVTARGKSAHVGRQFEGKNAFEELIPVFGRLLELKREVEQRRTQHPLTPAAARNSILLLGGRVEAGTNFNVVPDVCSFTLDRRINPEENLRQEKQRLLEALSGLEVEMLQEEEAAATSVADPLALALARSVEQVTGRGAAFELCPGLLETRFYAARGVAALAYGPGLLTVSHGPNEFVPVGNLSRCAAIYALTATELLG